MTRRILPEAWWPTGSVDQYHHILRSDGEFDRVARLGVSPLTRIDFENLQYGIIPDGDLMLSDFPEKHGVEKLPGNSIV